MERKKLRIGIVSNTSFNIFNYRFALIKALQNEGHTVFAIAPKDDFTEKLIEKKIQFIEVVGLTRKGTNPLNDIFLVNEFRKIYASNKLDIVFQYTIKPNIYGTLGAKLAGTKSICTVTGLGYVFLNEGLSSKIAKKLYRIAFNWANEVIFQNNDDAQIFKAKKLLLKDNFQIFAGSGVDTNHYAPSFCEKTSKEDTRFLMVSRLLIDKGIYEFVEAAKNIKAKYPNTTFQILGEMDYNNPAAIDEQTLNNWIAEKIFDYFPFNEDIRPFVCQADIIVLPSYREGLPRVILEGMAMEKICITTDAPGCVDTVEDQKTGFIAKVKDANSLQQKMEEALKMTPSEKELMQQSARQRVINLFDNKIIIQKYIEILKKYN